MSISISTPQMSPQISCNLSSLSDLNTITSIDLKKKNRCFHDTCNMKLSLASFPCKCGNTYCPKHRQCELHNCAYDFKEAGKLSLSTQLIKVSASKIEKL
jgi:hypothetical protein